MKQNSNGSHSYDEWESSNQKKNALSKNYKYYDVKETIRMFLDI